MLPQASPVLSSIRTSASESCSSRSRSARVFPSMKCSAFAAALTIFRRRIKYSSAGIEARPLPYPDVWYIVRSVRRCKTIPSPLTPKRLFPVGYPSTRALCIRARRCSVSSQMRYPMDTFFALFLALHIATRPRSAIAFLPSGHTPGHPLG